MAAAWSGAMASASDGPESQPPICRNARVTCSPARSRCAEFAERGEIGRRRHRQQDGMRGGRGEQDQRAAVDPVVQRHAEHRKKADAQPRDAPVVALPQRREAGAGEQNAGRRRDVRPHEQREREQKPGPYGAGEPVARSGHGATHQQHEACEKEDVGGGIRKAARRPLDVLHQARAEHHADRDRGENERQRQCPAQRQESAGTWRRPGTAAAA